MCSFVAAGVLSRLFLMASRAHFGFFSPVSVRLLECSAAVSCVGSVLFFLFCCRLAVLSVGVQSRVGSSCLLALPECSGSLFRHGGDHGGSFAMSAHPKSLLAAAFVCSGLCSGSRGLSGLVLCILGYNFFNE
jgi:hypothetical protein